MRFLKRLLMMVFGRRCRDCIFFKETVEEDESMFKGWEGRCSGRVEAFFIRRKPSDFACGNFEKEILA